MRTVPAETALRLAGLSRGDRFLDVSADAGGLSVAAARLGACVIQSDWGSSCSLEFSDDAFDVTGCWFKNTPAPEALREMVRVTTPGGRVVVTAYRSRSEIAEFVTSAIRAVVPDARLAIDRPQLVGRKLMGAGLKCVVYACIEEELAFRTGEELWDWVFATVASGADDLGRVTDVRSSAFWTGCSAITPSVRGRLSLAPRSAWA